MHKEYVNWMEKKAKDLDIMDMKNYSKDTSNMNTSQKPGGFGLAIQFLIFNKFSLKYTLEYVYDKIDTLYLMGDWLSNLPSLL